MSKKSTARTGSEGDADSGTSTEVFTNICSGSSSCKSKREIDGGPFGDAQPTQRNQDHFKDFLILMFQENEDQSETSHSTDEDQVLYNLKNDYLEKLNIVRKRLNLVELSNDDGNKIPIPQLAYNNRCKITEITEHSTSTPGTPRSEKDKYSCKDEHDSEQKETCSVESNNSGNITDTYELNTIYSPSPSYNNSADSASATNIYDLEYNPPKKKFCHRLRTPKFSSASEGNIPYYTKVTLREDLFKRAITKQVNSPKKKYNAIKRNIRKLTKSKATQCTQKVVRNRRRRSLEDSPQRKSKHTNLFPNVIVKVKENHEEKSASSGSLKRCTPISGSHKNTDSNVSPINCVRNSTDDKSYITITTSTTIVDSPKKKKVKKKTFKVKNKVTSSEKLTMWEEVRKLHSLDGSINVVKSEDKIKKKPETIEDVAVNTGECNSSPTIRTINTYINELANNAQLQKLIRNEASDDSPQDCQNKTDNISQYIKQYLKYKASLERVKNGIVSGGTLVTNINKLQPSLEGIYYSGSSLISDEERCSKDNLSSEDASCPTQGRTVFRTFWKTVCKMFCPCIASKLSD